MSESKFEKIKYRLLKIVDVSGFRVFDPVVRLFFKEEPKKQVGEILRYLVTPMLFVLICLGLWTVIAPRHKTKSGEVPTPTKVWEALIINDTLNTRENEKEADFQRSIKQSQPLIASISETIETKEVELKELKSKLVEVEADVKEEIESNLAPVQFKYDSLKAANKEASDARVAKIKELAVKVTEDKELTDELFAIIREDDEAKSKAKEAESELKEEINEIRSNPPKSLKKARLASNAVANEIQHLKKRLDYLTTGNRAIKTEAAKTQAEKSIEKLKTAQTPTAVLSAAKSVVRAEKKVEKISEQEYPRTATIWYQVKRSLFTVFIGFVMAAMIAIPVGIMCGLNKIIMACLTPIISIFKPVSPVVWLLIFQIIIGAFFPDPENHPFFVFMGSLPIIGPLGVNPALVFSACTVTMCAVWPALVNTALGVSSVEKDHINVAKVLRLGLWSRLFKIVIPSALPLVFAGLRISLGVGWMVLIAAEALSSSDGLGKFVWDEYQNGSSHSFANIIFACFVVGAIGFLLDRIMIILQRSVSFDEEGSAVV